MRQGTVSDPVIDQFPVWEDDGVEKRSGLTSVDFDFSVWVDGIPRSIPVGIVEIASTGEYKVTFTPDTLGYWKVEIFSSYSEDYYITEVEVSTATLASIDENLSRILGLLHYNALLDNQQYDEYGQLTLARLRVFDTEGHVPSAPGGNETVGLRHQYRIEAEYDGAGIVKLYRLLRVL
jgi:hypothetical protein